VEHSWGALKGSLNITAQAQLKQPPRAQRPWISEAALHLANCKRKLCQASLANPSPQAKAEYQVASQVAHKSALADYHHHFTQLVTKVQRSMRKGNTPSIQGPQAAHELISKPKCQPGRQLQHGISGRQLHTASKRIAEWLQRVTQLFTAMSPIAPEVLVLLAPPPTPPISQQDPPYPEVTLAEVITAIKHLKNNKSPGICNILPEILKYGGDSVHSALYRVILGISRTEQAPQDFKQDILLPIPKKGDASLCSNYRPAEHSWDSLCQRVECTPFTVAGRQPS